MEPVGGDVLIGLDSRDSQEFCHQLPSNGISLYVNPRILVLIVLGPILSAQDSKRILGVIPNFRTSPTLKDYKPLSTQEKFKLAAEDSFDRGNVVLAAVFAGKAQLTNANRPFGQGAAGYARYFGTGYADIVIGDFMTEAIYPTMLHQDPRYFRRGEGTGRSRLFYAMGQILMTHKDSGGGSQFNYSELFGNATAVAISNSYYSANRTAADATSKLGVQLGIDMAGNLLKEFWPDIARHISRHGDRRGP